MSGARPALAKRNLDKLRPYGQQSVFLLALARSSNPAGELFGRLFMR